MYITMQGNWKVSVKVKEAAYDQRFIIKGAVIGNGTYHGVLSTPPISVQGNRWTIDVQSNPGSGFQNSDVKITYPKKIGSNYVFEIQSNDAGGDKDYDDLILQCSTPVTSNDYVVSGNVKTYSGNCIINPCYPGWIVLESYKALIKAHEISALSDAINTVYPERRIPVIGDINPPDPGPFIPMMISLGQSNQNVERVANIFEQVASPDTEKIAAPAKKSEGQQSPASPATELQLMRSMSIRTNLVTPSLRHDPVELSKIADSFKKLCWTGEAPFLTLKFYEYDRTSAELAGGSYTGEGARQYLGSTITDMNGNYVFRFQQSLVQQVLETAYDTAPGEDPLMAYRPDLIVCVEDASTPPKKLYESAPYWNIPYLKRLNLCMPESQIPELPDSNCVNGNLIGKIGDVYVGGPGQQNTTGSFLDAHLERKNYPMPTPNHLHPDGRISVGDPMAKFNSPAICACWNGTLFLRGCMYNIERKPKDPVISYFTIRYKKPSEDWKFVSESQWHPNYDTGHNDLYGPHERELKVDGFAKSVASYRNIQKECFMDNIHWDITDIFLYMTLNSSIYEAGTPGTVYFMVEGYDKNGDFVPGARDLIPLYIDNQGLAFSLNDAWIAADGTNIVKAECNLYRIKEDYLNSPLRILFKANDPKGFLDQYTLTVSKCNSAGFSLTESPSGKSSGTNPQITDAVPCGFYYGTDLIEIDFAPSTGGNGKWLALDETYTYISIELTARQRVTNGYNEGLSPYYYRYASIAVERMLP